MTVPSGPDQPSRGYGARPPQDSAAGQAGQPQQPGPQQPGYGAPQGGYPAAPQPGPQQGQPLQQPGPQAPGPYGAPQQPQHPQQPTWGQQPPPPQPQYQQPQQGWAQQPHPQGGYPQQPQQPYFPQLPRQTAHFNPVMLLPIHHWLRDRSLRNWITILFVALVVVPSIALVYVGDDVTKISKSTWAFAIYFACAWLLVLWIAIRPPMIRPMMLLEVGLIGLIFEAPLAIWLEKKLEEPNQNLFAYIFTVGLPEEFVKILPIVVLGLILKNVWGPLTPKDYLFLGAVSGLAFGAAEAVQYINVYIPGNSGEIATAAANQGADPSSIGQYIAMTSIQSGSWRFVTDPMSHAVWAGISGYFVGLAFQHRRYFWLALVGLGLTSVLHGINDDVAGHWFWIVEIVISVLLFMAYVQAGGVIEQQLTEADEAHARQAGQYGVGYPAGAYAMPMQQPMGAPGWGQGAPPPPGPGTSGGWSPAGAGTGSFPAAPSWNPAAGWGQSGFTPLPGYRPPAGGQQPPQAQ
ncbi:MAG TPA: PrsW family glutamic-type intramembrane protease [Actinospica sp.]|jgi:RsiW-degrading membrane proteinase PrsW (M82 family)|nr:PrsW family glutamic-type intramembrane protease [Actinospica sp.]